MILFLFLFNAQVNKNLSFLVPIDYSNCRNRNPAEKWVFGFFFLAPRFFFCKVRLIGFFVQCLVQNVALVK